MAHIHAIVRLIGSGHNLFASIVEQNVSILDIVNAEKLNSPVLNENVIILEDQLQTQSVFSRTITETAIAIADSITAIPKTIRQLFETVPILETVDATLTSSRTLPENTTFSEIIVAFPGEGRSIIESTISILDSVSTSITTNRILPETVAISEEISTGADNFRTLFENTSVFDIVELKLDHIRNIPQNNSISENLTKTISTSRTLIENTSISDVLTTLSGIFPTKAVTANLCVETEVSSNLCMETEAKTDLCI